MSKPSRGQAALSGIVVALLVAMIAGNLPNAGWTATLITYTQPLRSATGLNQNWTVFAPPRTISAYVEARLDFADNTSRWVPITTREGLGAFVDYRWHKYEESLRTDSGSNLWEPYARYVADRSRAAGQNPLRITLIRRWAETMPPGSGPQRGPWHEFTMYVLGLT